MLTSKPIKNEFTLFLSMIKNISHFRLQLSEDDSVIVQFPDQVVAERYIDNPGNVGYKLLDPLLTLYDGDLRTVKLVGLETISENDTTISFRHIKND